MIPWDDQGDEDRPMWLDRTPLPVVVLLWLGVVVLAIRAL